MRSFVLTIFFSCVVTAGYSATDGVEPAPVPVVKPAPVRTDCARAVRHCHSSWRRARIAGGRGHVAAGSASAVVAPVDAPMLPPLGAHVWRHEDPPLFDPYDSAGPWYTGPWTHAGTNVSQWRYGFPGGHVDWFRKLGWRPGFGWY